MKIQLKCIVLIGAFAALGGCQGKPPNTFKFTADLPPGFAYNAIVEYTPVKGETCSVSDRRKTVSAHNQKWRERYEPTFEIPIRRTISGCPMAIRRISLDINSTYGKSRGDFSADSAVVAVLTDIEERYKSRFDSRGESTFHGQCQWLFRTSGKPRILRKILDCKETDALGTPEPGRPFAAYTHDQLPGKTVKMKITLAREEQPYFRDTWVKFPNGWKRCLGDNFEDQYAFCYGNYTDFSTFKMPDGRVCTIYPGCTE
ncbi:MULTISPECIES: hypothetical protein [Pseudomonas]|uniref:hypothetical protein n=1 Tax=Pseudomonas TaxID=286 RepID=UPI001F3A0839|nr:hypothetical protein [Pseudomonas sputi]